MIARSYCDETLPKSIERILVNYTSVSVSEIHMIIHIGFLCLHSLCLVFPSKDASEISRFLIRELQILSLTVSLIVFHHIQKEFSLETMEVMDSSLEKVRVKLGSNCSTVIVHHHCFRPRLLFFCLIMLNQLCWTI